MSVSICWVSIDKSVSLFHTQFVLDLFFFSKQFQSHCIYKIGEVIWGQLSSGQSTEGQLSWGKLSRCNNLGQFCRGQSSRRQFSSGQLSGGQFSSGSIVLEGNCLVGNHLGSNCPGGNYLWGNFPRRQLSGPPGKVSSILSNPFPVPSLFKLDHIVVCFIQNGTKNTSK